MILAWYKNGNSYVISRSSKASTQGAAGNASSIADVLKVSTDKKGYRKEAFETLLPIADLGDIIIIDELDSGKISPFSTRLVVNGDAGLSSDYWKLNCFEGANAIINYSE
jgi:hypothetical protein